VLSCLWFCVASGERCYLGCCFELRAVLGLAEWTQAIRPVAPARMKGRVDSRALDFFQKLQMTKAGATGERNQETARPTHAGKDSDQGRAGPIHKRWFGLKVAISLPQTSPWAKGLVACVAYIHSQRAVEGNQLAGKSARRLLIFGRSPRGFVRSC